MSIGYEASAVNETIKTRIPQFYLTPAGPCPYLPGRSERKVFTRLEGMTASALNAALTHSGFRRSQAIAYKPACEGCIACVSVRVPVADFIFSRNRRRVLAANADLIRREEDPVASREQYALLRRYLDSRHAGGGMAGMSLFEYAVMVEETTVDTQLIHYRVPGTLGEELVGCCLTDVLGDGLSMVYSFYHPAMASRSLGTFMILDHIRMARECELPYVYLGYWVNGCRKMEYKVDFRPLECLKNGKWIPFEEWVGA